MRFSKTAARRFELVPTADMISSLLSLRSRFPEQSQFIYDFANTLARMLLRNPVQIHINRLTGIIQNILLLDYAKEPVCFPGTVEPTTAARLILSKLQDILDKVCSPVYSQLIVSKIRSDEKFMIKLSKNPRGSVH